MKIIRWDWQSVWRHCLFEVLFLPFGIFGGVVMAYGVAIGHPSFLFGAVITLVLSAICLYSVWMELTWQWPLSRD